MADKETIAKMITMLEEMDPRETKEISSLGLNGYLYALQDIPNAILENAVLLYIETVDPPWVPSPAKLRELSQHVINQLPLNIRCEQAAAIASSTEYKTYKDKIHAYDDHIESCEVCTDDARPQLNSPFSAKLQEVKQQLLPPGGKNGN